MISSGVTGSFNLDVSDVIEHAARRCGVPVSELGLESSKILTDNLWMLLSAWSNRGMNLWRLYRPMFGLKAGQAEYAMNTGDIEVENALYRTPAELSATVVSSAGSTVANLTDRDIDTVATQSGANGNFQWTFDEAQNVALFGLLPNGNNTYNLVFEASPDGATWTTVYAQGSTAYVDNVWQWLAFDPTYPWEYFRVRETGGATMSFREMFPAAQWQDITLAPMNKDDYANMPSKRSPGRAVQYWFDRQLTPKMILWPVPNTSFAIISTITHRHIEDVGAMSNTLNIPQRWFEPVVWNLAYMSIAELPKADLARFPMIKGMKDQSVIEAENEDRDKSPITITPDIAVYTR